MALKMALNGLEWPWMTSNGLEGQIGGYLFEIEAGNIFDYLASN